jgi:hypothetical protein
MAAAQFFQEGSTAVQGTEEFGAALGRMSRGLKSSFQRRNREIGGVVVAAAQQRAASYSLQAARAAAAISATAARSGVAVRISSAKVPFALGAEFGARQYPQFPPWTGNQWTTLPTNVGYFFHPAIIETRDAVNSLYMQAVADAASAAGLTMDNTPRAAGILDVVPGL